MRYTVLVASIVLQFCMGAVYAWSVFIPPLTGAGGLTTTQTQVIFGSSVFFFTLSMILAGRLQDRWGPGVVAPIGGALFAGAYLTASASGGSFLWLFLGMSVLLGTGIGFGYVCPIATCIEWFPNRKGLVTGISVSAFGGGAVLLSALAGHWLERGTDVFRLFQGIGLVYGPVIVGMGLLLRRPPQCAALDAAPAPPVMHLVRQRMFWFLSLGIFCGTFAGLLVIGNLKPIGLSAGVDPRLATLGVGAFSIGNALGRITWGWIVDRIERAAVPFSLGYIACSLVALGFMRSGSAAFLAGAALVGFGFGSNFVVYAAQVASHYGVSRVGAVYPMVFFLYGISGVLGPLTGGWLYDATGSYLPAILAAAALAGAGSLGSWVTHENAKIRSSSVEEAEALSTPLRS